MAKRNGAFADRFRVSLRVACFSAITALADYTCFGNHSAGGQPMHHSVLPEEEALDREGGRHRQGKRWLVRTGWQNGIPCPQGRALAGGSYFDLLKNTLFQRITIPNCTKW